MAILKDCELWFPKLDPKRPNPKFDKENPTWDLQIRTTSKEVKKYWESLNLGVKAIVPDEGAPYFRVNLRKKSIKADGTEASPVTVVNGSLEAIDAKTIGNGSRGNVRIFQYEYPSKTGKPGIASVLMAVQITKHVVYKPKPRDDEFGMEETETIQVEDTADSSDSFDDADF
jgi:hypothetical protein